MKNIILFLGFLALCELAFAGSPVRIQILHTSDIHSQYYNDGTPLQLGGVARLKTLIDGFKAKNENTLLLDSGDWTEGAIFFNLKSGEANHKLMESLSYDAIVLGNHEWLVGPQELYEAFAGAKMQVPVLGANLNFEDVDKRWNLKKYIKPYIVKEVGGKRVGIFGLSTFELIYDRFFMPVKIDPPAQMAQKIAKHLKQEEKCDVVIALTHIGFYADKIVAEASKDIDMVVGGHSHILLQQPHMVGDTPIVHIGKWAWYLGQYELLIDENNKVSLSHHEVHEVHRNIKPDAATEVMVDGFRKTIEKTMGPVFQAKAVYSEVDLSLDKKIVENAVGNWTVDAFFEKTDVDFAVDSPNFSGRPLYRGWSTIANVFNLYPHTYTKKTGKTWTVKTFEVRGWVLKALLNTMFAAGSGLKVSNAEIELDFDNRTLPISKMRIGGKNIKNFKNYKVAGTNGIIEAFETLRMFGIDLGIKNLKDTGIEPWKVILEKLQKISPITPDKAVWEGRIRSLQPDLHIPSEQIIVKKINDTQAHLRFQVINAGLTKAPMKGLRVKIDSTPENTLDSEWEEHFLPRSSSELEPGEVVDFQLNWDIRNKAHGPYRMWVSVDSVEGEKIVANNHVSSFIYLPEPAHRFLSGWFSELIPRIPGIDLSKKLTK